jgi:polyferredoxin
MALKSIRLIPGYIYVIAFLLAVPGTWLLVGAPGEDVPGMIGMVIMIVLFAALAMVLDLLRRRLKKHDD